MRNFIILTALFTLGVAGIHSAPSQAATITLFHGVKTETVDTAKEPAAGLHIIRPVSKAVPIKTPASERQSSDYRNRQNIYASGNTLWIHNNRTGRFIGCYVGSSGMVGRDIIRCSAPRRIRR
jgi:hypothetical protein